MNNNVKSIISKIFGLVLTLVISLFTMGMEVSASAPTSGSVSVKGNKINEYVLPGYGPQFALKYMNGNYYVYCLNHRLDYPTGQTFTKSNALNAGITYILANGFPNKSITGDNVTDYYITQVAIWWYLDDTASGNNLGSYYKNNAASTTIGKKIYDLKQAAKNHSTYAKPSLSASIASNDLTLDSTGQYYVSKEITVNAVSTEGNYNVTLADAPAGSFVTDLSGKVRTGFAPNEKFIVKVPVNSMKVGTNNFVAYINATGRVKKAYEYKASSSSIQNVALTTLYNDDTPLNAAINLKFTKQEDKYISISKQDITTKEELPGATLIIKDAKGKEIEKWVSQKEPKQIKNLADGKYTLQEIIAPDGYVLSSEIIEFEVKNGKTTAPVIMYNKKEDKYISISKQDITTKEELPGATLIIKDAKGKEIEKWVSQKEPKQIKNLADGKYTLQEIIAPDGYVLSSEIIEFEVKNGKLTAPVIMYNYPEVTVPPTAASVPVIVYIIGLTSLALGMVTVYRKVKYNK